MTRIFVVGLISSVLFGCDLSLAGKHSCASDRDCLNGRICEEQRCVNRRQEDGGDLIWSEDGDASVDASEEEELDAEPAPEDDEAGSDEAGSDEAGSDEAGSKDAEPAPIVPVACTFSEDCPADQVCEKEQHVCAGCNVNADCRAGRVCDRGLARCVACTSHEQCNDGSLTEDMPPPVIGSAAWTLRACYGQACKPVECLADRQCNRGCNLEFNICRQCSDHGDCSSGRCDLVSHSCVACIRDSDCSSGWCGGDNECVAAARCKLWDTFPPSTRLGNLVSTGGDGYALADNYQIYRYERGLRGAWDWRLYRAAPTTPVAPEAVGQSSFTKLVASREFVAAVMRDGTILRGGYPMVAIGQFQQISAITALDHRLWVATEDGKLRMHESNWGDCSSTRSCAPGMSCFLNPSPHCASSTEVHETASGIDKTLFATEGAFDSSARMTGVAIHGGEDPGELLYLTTGSPFTITSRQFFYRDARGWHSDLVDACMLQTGIASFYTAYAAPGTMVTACIGRGVAGVLLNGVNEQIADTTSAVSNAPAWLVQLSDPPSMLLWWPGTVPLVRTASGYLPFALPAEGEQRALTSNLRPIGGTLGKIVYYEAKGTLSEFSYETSAGWKVVTAPFHDLDPTHFWSTDGWESVYAISRDGALLQCRLD